MMKNGARTTGNLMLQLWRASRANATAPMQYNGCRNYHPKAYPTTEVEKKFAGYSGTTKGIFRLANDDVKIEHQHFFGEMFTKNKPLTFKDNETMDEYCQPGLLLVNTDAQPAGKNQGSDPGLYSCGVVYRHPEERYVADNALGIRFCLDIDEAELNGIWLASKLYPDRNLYLVTDCHNCYTWINQERKKELKHDCRLGSLVKQVVESLDAGGNRKYKVVHWLGKKNILADSLAKIGQAVYQDEDLKNILDDSSSGVLTKKMMKGMVKGRYGNFLTNLKVAKSQGW